MTIFGWDCSNWDHGRGPVDIARAVREGISFVTHKATEGRGYTDPYYGSAAARARGVVPLFGAYHVLHPDPIASIGSQVDHFLAVLDEQSPWWRSGPFIVQLDCERWSANDFPQLPDIRAWCDRFVARTGGQWHPIVYASHGQYGGNLTGLNRPLWNANYGSNASGPYRSRYPGDLAGAWQPYSGRTPDILQYTSAATIAGQGNCDANAYRGSIDQLRALIGGDDMGTAERAENADRNAWAVRMGVNEPVFPNGQPGQLVSPGNPLWDVLRRIDAATAADATRDAATLAAIQALATSGTSVDTAAVVTAINAARDASRQQYEQLGEQLAATQAALAAAHEEIGRLRALEAAAAKAGAQAFDPQ